MSTARTIIKPKDGVSINELTGGFLKNAVAGKDDMVVRGNLAAAVLIVAREFKAPVSKERFEKFTAAFDSIVEQWNTEVLSKSGKEAPTNTTADEFIRAQMQAYLNKPAPDAMQEKTVEVAARAKPVVSA